MSSCPVWGKLLQLQMPNTQQVPSMHPNESQPINTEFVKLCVFAFARESDL